MSTQKEIAKHLDLSVRRIRSLTKNGILPPSKGTGGYDIDTCRVAYINYLRGVSSGQVDEHGDNRNDESYSALLEKEKYRKEKRQNDLEEQLVAPVSQITDALVKTGTQIIARLDALPLEMKRRNPKLTGHDIMIVKKCIANCRNGIADMEIEL